MALHAVSAIATGAASIAGEGISQTIAGLSDQILESSRNVRVNADVVLALSQRVTNMAAALAEELALVETPPEAVASFERCLKDILHELQDQTKHSYFSQILHQKRDKERWAALSRRFDDAFDILMVQMRIQASAALSSQLESLRARPLIAIDISEPPTALPIPPKPAFCFGRAVETQTVVDAVCGASAGRVAILGGPGMGKTTLALAVLHAPAVALRFSNRRFFGPCDAVEGTRTCLSAIADVFGVAGPDTRVLMLKVREAVGSAPTLLVLDNFESAWEAPEHRADSEQALRFLEEIPNLSFVLTMRGNERPQGVRWTRPFLAPLERLGEDDSRQTFYSLADVSAGDSDAALKSLLSYLDGVPLAITLMASLAQYEAVGTLLCRWKAFETAILVRGDGQHRLSSVDVSIGLSLRSPRMRALPAAATLLGMLSLLPHGVVDSDLPLWNVGQSSQATSVLFANALATCTADHRIHVLAPIRSYMLTMHPLSEDEITPVYQHYFTITELAIPTAGDAPFFPDTLSAVTHELDNLDFIIRHALKHSVHARARAIQTVKCLCRLYWSSGIGSGPDLVAAALSAAESPALDEARADLLLEAAVSLARFGDPRSQVTEARRIYEHAGKDDRVFECRVLSIKFLPVNDAIAEAEQLLTTACGRGDLLHIARCRAVLADGLRRAGSIHEAIALYNQSLRELQAHNSPNRLIGRCMFRLAICYDDLCKPTLALKFYEEALFTWKEQLYYSGVVIVHQKLATGCLNHGRPFECVQHASQALAMYTATSGTHCVLLETMAIAYALMGDANAAEAALARLQSVRRELHASAQNLELHCRGIVAYCRGSLDEARALLDAAWAFSRSVDAVQSPENMRIQEASVIMSLADLHCAQKGYGCEDVIVLGCIAAVIYRKGRMMFFVINALLMLADGMDDERAEHLLSAILLPLHRFENRAGLAQWLVRSAAIARHRGDLQLARKRAMHALKFYGDIKSDSRVKLANEIAFGG